MTDKKKAKKPVKKVEKPTTRNLQASDLLNTSHPLHNSFAAWAESKPGDLTRRKARKYLRLFPKFREVQVPIETETEAA